MNLLNDLWAFVTGPIYAIIGSTASLVSLAITIWVLINVRNIKSHYVRAIRVPDLLKKLKTHTRLLSELMNDYGVSRDQIRREIAQCEVTLRSLHGKIDSQSRKEISSLIKTVQSYDWRAQDRDALYNILIGLEKLETRIALLKQDSEVER